MYIWQQVVQCGGWRRAGGWWRALRLFYDDIYYTKSLLYLQLLLAFFVFFFLFLFFSFFLFFFFSFSFCLTLFLGVNSPLSFSSRICLASCCWFGYLLKLPNWESHCSHETSAWVATYPRIVYIVPELKYVSENLGSPLYLKPLHRANNSLHYDINVMSRLHTGPMPK